MFWWGWAGSFGRVAGSKKYTLEQRQLAVGAYRELLTQGHTQAQARALAGERLGVNPSSLRTWIERGVVWRPQGAGCDDEVSDRLSRELELTRVELERAESGRRVATAAVRFFDLAGLLPPPALISAFGCQRVGDMPSDVVSSVLSDLFWPDSQLEINWALFGPSDQDLRDAQDANTVWDLWVDNYRCYGRTKMFHLMARRGLQPSRRRVKQLMGLVGAKGLKEAPRQTSMKVVSRPEKWGRMPGVWPVPTRLDQWWSIDVTRVPVNEVDYAVVFVVDVASRRVLTWKVSPTGQRIDLPQLVAEAVAQRTDQGAGLGAVPKGGKRALTLATDLSATDLQDLAGLGLRGAQRLVLPTCGGLFQAGLVGRLGTVWGSRVDLEASLDRWVTWYNTTRLHSGLGYRSPVEVEADMSG